MPVSVVCESTANVTAALRESLGSGYASSALGGDDTKAGVASAGNGNNGGMGSSSADDADCLQSKLAATAKRVLLSKIDYEEVANYNQSVLDTLKSKYIVLKPSAAANGNGLENGRASPAAACNNHQSNNGSANMNGNGTTDANGNYSANSNNNNSSSTAAANASSKRGNPNELPQPKRILYPRENVHIGWKNSTRKWQVGVGMMNVGNTCYLNSTLQALFHVPSMAHWLLSDTSHMEQCDAADGCIICAMAKTLQASQNSQSAIRPYCVYSKLRLICKHLVMGRQEDAHEFLRYLVEAMEKSYLMRCRNYKELDQYSKETTPLNQILGGYLKSAVRCLACGHVSVTFQHFQDLLLDIRKADSIEEALEGYFSRERLEDMGYKCESCKKKVSATKQFSLERAPIALCIQLKRFSVMGTKLNKQITIKPRLDLTKFASRKQPGEQLTYRLVAMVTHLGASQHCGHYTAIGLTESGTYYNYDDSYVRPISEQSVCNTNAYIIFYELDNAPPRSVTSTQVSGEKENYQKVNGYVSGVGVGNCRASPQRMIGPQLPPGGLGSLNANRLSVTNGGSPFNNNRKLSTNRQGGIPTSGSNGNSSSNNNNSSKTTIHFKNNNNSTSLKSNVSSSITTATATSSSPATASTAAATPSYNVGAHLQQNGLLAGTGKFQESAHAKSTLAGASNKRQTDAAANGDESSCSSDHEDEVSSSTQPLYASSSTRATLPSMPKLFENNGHSSSNTITAAAVGNGACAKKSPATVLVTKSPLKSLVPYGSESDDESASGETKRVRATTSANNSAAKKTLKRRNSCSSGASSSDNTDADDSARSGNGVKVKKAGSSSSSSHNNSNAVIATNGSGNSYASQQSKIKQQQQQQQQHKTDAILEIFNSNKSNANSYSNHHNNSSNGNTPSSTPLKKKKSQSQFVVSSTTPTTDSDSDDNERSATSTTTAARPPFKRSHSTPPSPPVIKTKTGMWQVTSLQPVTTCVSPPEQKAPPKNPKNPFATKTPPDLFGKRAKYSGAEKSEARAAFAGNGYQRDTVSDSAVSELLKQSHRGYGAPVLSWNGTQTEIEKEVITEAREQRQRDWEDEEENEMDRGRPKKVKAYKEAGQQSNRTPGYNPFQQEQENQRRWKHGAGQRFYAGHIRHQFQRNKFRFQRFNHKFQRMSAIHHRNQSQGHGGGGGGSSSNGQHSNGGYNRRDS